MANLAAKIHQIVYCESNVQSIPIQQKAGYRSEVARWLLHTGYSCRISGELGDPDRFRTDSGAELWRRQFCSSSGQPSRLFGEECGYGNGKSYLCRTSTQRTDKSSRFSCRTLSSCRQVRVDFSRLDIEKVDCLLRSGKYEDALEYVDQTVLIEHFGFDSHIVRAVRRAWVELRDRRINRKPS